MRLDRYESNVRERERGPSSLCSVDCGELIWEKPDHDLIRISGACTPMSSSSPHLPPVAGGIVGRSDRAGTR
eukprot:5993832-Pleurochrysis_carterae.AAC.1